MEPAPILGTPGEPVPPVDPADIRAALKMRQDIDESHPGQRVSIGLGVWEQYCSKGANIRAVFYRASFLDWIFRHEPEFAPWVKDGKPDDVVFRALAEIPMDWMQPGVPRQGPPFDGEDFMQRLRGE